MVLRSYSQPLISAGGRALWVCGGGAGALLFRVADDLGALVVLVVNTGLVMVDSINQHRRGNQSIISVVKEAGGRRFRPIMLTAVTTVPSLGGGTLAAAWLRDGDKWKMNLAVSRFTDGGNQGRAPLAPSAPPAESGDGRFGRWPLGAGVGGPPP